MVKGDLFKMLMLFLFMGASEAMTFLDALEKHGLLSRRTVAQYVLPTLYGSRETKEGTPGYAAMEKAVYGEAFDEMLGRRRRAVDDSAEVPVSREAAMYLRGILELVTGDRGHRLTFRGRRFDGFSRAAYEEVKRLLGGEGTAYLGVTGRHESLAPGRSMVDAIVMEDESEGILYSTSGRRPLWDPDPWENDPAIEELRRGMEEYEQWLDGEEQREMEKAIECAGGDDVLFQSVFSIDL